MSQSLIDKLSEVFNKIGEDVKLILKKLSYFNINELDNTNTENELAVGSKSISLGINSHSNGDYSVSIGNNNTSDGINSITIGKNATTSGNNSISIGKNSTATIHNSIALGNDSIYNREAIDISTIYRSNSQDVIATTTNMYGGLSIGDDTHTRQIINVAAGSENSDAVNVAQLKNVASEINRDTGWVIISDNVRYIDGETALWGRRINNIVYLFIESNDDKGFDLLSKPSSSSFTHIASLPTSFAPDFNDYSAMFKHSGGTSAIIRIDAQGIVRMAQVSRLGDHYWSVNYPTSKPFPNNTNFQITNINDSNSLPIL